MNCPARLSLSVALVSGFWSSARAQLLWPGREPGEPSRAVTVGFAMNHGVFGIGFDQAISRTPLVVGLGAGADGYGIHLDLGLPQLRSSRPLSDSDNGDMAAEPYVSLGLLAMPRHNEHAAGGLWLFECGARSWPRARPGLYFDVGVGIMRSAYGDVGALEFLPLPSFRFLAGVAF